MIVSRPTSIHNNSPAACNTANGFSSVAGSSNNKAKRGGLIGGIKRSLTFSKKDEKVDCCKQENVVKKCEAVVAAPSSSGNTCAGGKRNEQMPEGVVTVEKKVTTTTTKALLSSTTSLKKRKKKVGVVRFNNSSYDNTDEVHVQVFNVPRSCEQDAWYSDVELLAMSEDAKAVVMQYQLKCHRYCTSLIKIAQKCSKSSSPNGIAHLLDPQMLEKIVGTAARGLEQEICPRNVDTAETAKQQLWRLQNQLRCSSSNKGDMSAQLAEKYSQLSKTAQMIAKTMADGDALVATRIASEPASTATTTMDDTLQLELTPSAAKYLAAKATSRPTDVAPCRVATTMSEVVTWKRGEVEA